MKSFILLFSFLIPFSINNINETYTIKVHSKSESQFCINKTIDDVIYDHTCFVGTDTTFIYDNDAFDLDLLFYSHSVDTITVEIYQHAGNTGLKKLVTDTTIVEDLFILKIK